MLDRLLLLPALPEGVVDVGVVVDEGVRVAPGAPAVGLGALQEGLLRGGDGGGGEEELTTKCAKRKMTERQLEESRGTMIRKRRWGEGVNFLAQIW